jgi:hypothetical protein
MTESLWLTFLQTAILALGAGALFALPVGLALLFAPDRLAKMLFVLDRWIPLDGIVERLNATYRLERLFYRNHKKFGLFLVIGSAYNLYFQATYRGAEIATLFAIPKHAEIVGWLSHSIWLVLLLANTAALVIGAVVFHRPSLLKGIEAFANHWIGDEPLTITLDQARFGVQRILYRHRRLTGLAIVGGAFYVLATLALYARHLF